ncbi:MAG: UDP-N-acetylmuramate dehydrogenase [Prevotella sp.]|nr:UDP-N-acetylmuramate dehydrogenase [Prevotella sp.]
MKEYTDYSLKAHNTFGIDARCRHYVEYATADEACLLARRLSEPFLIIGGGSNLLLTRDYEGTVVRSAVMGMEVVGRDEGTVTVRVGSGEQWDAVVARFVANGWYGAENLSLIPGDVGATAVQNIGAYGAEACDLIEQVEAVAIGNGQKVTINAADCCYGYRQSRFKQEWKNHYLITHVTYRLSLTFRPRLDYGNIKSVLQQRGIGQPTAQQLRDAIIAIRREKLPDPQVQGNAGSFFMNPMVERSKFEELLQRYPDMPHYHVDNETEKIPAGWMIDRCGWKGKSMGRAGVHDKQALVLVNRGEATGQEIVSLCEAIRNDVLATFGIEIKPEVNIV